MGNLQKTIDYLHLTIFLTSSLSPFFFPSLFYVLCSLCVSAVARRSIFGSSHQFCERLKTFRGMRWGIHTSVCTSEGGTASLTHDNNHYGMPNWKEWKSEKSTYKASKSDDMYFLKPRHNSRKRLNTKQKEEGSQTVACLKKKRTSVFSEAGGWWCKYNFSQTSEFYGYTQWVNLGKEDWKLRESQKIIKLKNVFVFLCCPNPSLFGSSHFVGVIGR